MIVKGIPFNASECHFLKLWCKRAKRPKPPNRRKLSGRLLDVLYEIVIRKIENCLTEADFFAITCDAWTSDAQDKYVGVTAHFVTRGNCECSMALRNTDLFCRFVLEIPLSGNNSSLGSTYLAERDKRNCNSNSKPLSGAH